MNGNEICIAMRGIGEKIENKNSASFDIFKLFEFSSDSKCRYVIDYADLSRKWRPLSSSSIGFECDDPLHCHIETDLVVPYDVTMRDIRLFKTIDNCEIVDIHEKFTDEKHIHLNCKVKIQDLEDVIQSLIETHKYVISKF